MRDVLKLIAAILISQAAGAIGSIFTFTAINEWYAYLRKPPITPPSWVFSPVWTLLYTMMGIAAWLVWRKGLQSAGVKAALTLFLVQLVFNAAWSVLFFGLRSPLWAFVEICFLWAAIALTTVAFFGLSRAAWVLMLPYLLWVTFAAVLNYWVYWLNC